MTPIKSSEDEATIIAIADKNIKSNEEEEDSKIVKPSIPIAEASDIYIFPDRKKMNEIETYEELTNQAKLHNDLPLPRDLNILYLGDSLTRYQYLDMVYFLKHGSWADPADEPSFLIEKHHETWNDFYNFTNGGLKPYEECDCFRQEGGVKMYKKANLIENRYFQDLERNNTVTYLQKFGDDFLKSHWDVSDIHKPHSLLTDWSEYNPVHWLNWVEMIEKFVCKMEPKPSIFIFNAAGLWRNNDLVNVTLQGEIVKALKQCDILSMFKTTTKQRSRTDRLMAEYEEQLCNQTDYCLDLTWTGMVPKDLYFDQGHFIPPVYSYMNLELLSILSSMYQEK